MKIKIINRKSSVSVLLMAYFITCAHFLWSQTICTDNTNIVYGFSVTGGVYPININTGVVGTAIGTINDGSHPDSNANAFGYNSVNNKFYGFYRCAAAVAPLSEFVSYNPATNTTLVLATPPFGTTTKIRSGCVNNSGSGYYCIDILGGVCSLWYYNIVANTWTKITSTFKNGATDYTATFQSLNSGDMAFDASGNLWMIISKSTQYALYRIPNPVPTTAIASATVQQIIAPISTPTQAGTAPNQASFTGLAFNANGVAYLTTGSGTGAANNQLYKMATTVSGITYVGPISLGGSGDDLTSCVFTYALPVRWLGFSAKSINQKGIQLNWEVMEDINVKQYHIERSTDAAQWETFAVVQRKSPDASRSQYDYTDYDFHSGQIYYRVIQEDVSGKTYSSDVKQIAVTNQNLRISPNPAKDKLMINQTGTLATQAQIFDSYGRLIMETFLHYSNESIDISKLLKGNYFLKLSIGTTEISHAGFIKL